MEDVDVAAELERELAAMDDVPEEEEEDDDAFYERLANLSAWRGDDPLVAEDGGATDGYGDPLSALRSGLAAFSSTVEHGMRQATGAWADGAGEPSSVEQREEECLQEAAEMFEFTKEEEAEFRRKFFETLPVVEMPESSFPDAEAENLADTSGAADDDEHEAADGAIQKSDHVAPADVSGGGGGTSDSGDSTAQGGERRASQVAQQEREQDVAPNRGSPSTLDGPREEEEEEQVEEAPPWFLSQIKRRPVDRAQFKRQQEECAPPAEHGTHASRDDAPATADLETPTSAAHSAGGRTGAFFGSETVATVEDPPAESVLHPALVRELEAKRLEQEREERRRSALLQEKQRKRAAEAAQREAQFQRVHYEQARMFAGDRESRLREREDEAALFGDRRRMAREDVFSSRVRELERDARQKKEREELEREWRRMKREDVHAFALREAEACARERLRMEKAAARSEGINRLLWREWDRMGVEDARAASIAEHERREKIEWPRMLAEDADTRTGLGESLAAVRDETVSFWAVVGRNSWLLLRKQFGFGAKSAAEEEGTGNEQDDAVDTQSDCSRYSPRSGGSCGRSSVDELLAGDEAEAAEQDAAHDVSTSIRDPRAGGVSSRENFLFPEQLGAVKEQLARRVARVPRSVAENAARASICAVPETVEDHCEEENEPEADEDLHPEVDRSRSLEAAEVVGQRPAAVWESHHARQLQLLESPNRNSFEDNDEPNQLSCFVRRTDLSGPPPALPDFEKLRHVRHLKLEGFDLSTASRTFVRSLASSCVMLEHLCVTRSRLRSLAGLQHLLNLYSLDASHNCLTDVDFLSSGCPRLAEAVFRDNRVVRLPEASGRSRASRGNLQRLDLAGNRIGEITATCFLRDCEALGKLDLSRNRLQGRLDGSLLSKWTPFLVELRVAQNNLQSFEHFVLLLLEHLDASGNKLRFILPGGGFSPMGFFPSLRTVNLRENEISELPPSQPFCSAPNLVTLDLSRNRLTALPTGAFSNFPKLGEVRIGANAGLCRYKQRYRRHVLRALGSAANSLEIWDDEPFKSEAGDAYYNRAPAGAQDAQRDGSRQAFFDLAASVGRGLMNVCGGQLAQQSTPTAEEGHAHTGTPSVWATLQEDETAQDVAAEIARLRFAQYRTLVEFYKDKVLVGQDRQRHSHFFGADFPAPFVISAAGAAPAGSRSSTSSSSPQARPQEADRAVSDRFAAFLRNRRQQVPNAVLQIQRLFRGWRTRQQCKRLRIQRRQKHFTDNIAKVRKIQSCVRFFLAYRSRLRFYAARIVQASWRGHKTRRRLRRVLATLNDDLDLEFMGEVDVSEFTYDAERWANPFTEIGKARARTEKTLKNIESTIQDVEALVLEDVGEEVGTRAFEDPLHAATGSSAGTTSRSSGPPGAPGLTTAAGERSRIRGPLQLLSSSSGTAGGPRLPAVPEESENELVQELYPGGAKHENLLPPDADQDDLPRSPGVSPQAQTVPVANLLDVTELEVRPAAVEVSPAGSPVEPLPSAADSEIGQLLHLLESSAPAPAAPRVTPGFLTAGGWTDVSTSAGAASSSASSGNASASTNGCAKIRIPIAVATADLPVAEASPILSVSSTPSSASTRGGNVAQRALAPGRPERPELPRSAFQELLISRKMQMHDRGLSTPTSVGALGSEPRTAGELPQVVGPGCTTSGGVAAPAESHPQPARRLLPAIDAAASLSSSAVGGSSSSTSKARIAGKKQERVGVPHFTISRGERDAERNLMFVGEPLVEGDDENRATYLNSARLAELARGTTLDPGASSATLSAERPRQEQVPLARKTDLRSDTTPRAGEVLATAASAKNQPDLETSSLHTETLETPQSLSRPSTSSARERAGPSKYEAKLQAVQEEWGFADAATAAAFLESQKKMKRMRLKRVAPGRESRGGGGTRNSQCASNISERPAPISDAATPSQQSRGSDPRSRANSDASTASTRSRRGAPSAGSNPFAPPRSAWAARKQMGPKAQDAIADYRRMKAEQEREQARAALDGSADGAEAESGEYYRGSQSERLPELREGGILQNIRAAEDQASPPRRSTRNHNPPSGR